MTRNMRMCVGSIMKLDQKSKVKRRVCGEMNYLCGAPPQGLCKAPHDSGVGWKQFMMLLEEVLVCGGVSPARPGSAKGFASV